ncbi:thrombospondin type 3 repeat-containing protein [Chryseobacterium sp. ERMR1:04]|uniref:thrombospondin type 3 repeat-containing protein n=1 Tax=Chryseobacterium sp. ERMR1:04 TaxID=1705393 RepID=UPI0006C89C10|nr:thrombospondin type 3 repeat-containing protein [Chryseobacterium sp. ERMR1:04]
MNKKIACYFLIILFCLSYKSSAQTYQDTPNIINKSGALKLNNLRNLRNLNTQCPSHNIIINGTFTDNANNWILQPGWDAPGSQALFSENYATNKDISQSLNNLDLANTNNFIPLTLTLGTQDGNQSAGSTAKLQILLNNTVYATIDNGTQRNPAINNVKITLSNGATSNFIPFTTANINGFTKQTFTVYIPSSTIPNTSTLIFRATTGIDDWLLEDISILAFTCDHDGDGVPDYIDLDNDNDGILDTDECPNIFENVDFSTSNNVPYTFTAPPTDLGFIFDVYQLDNSFNLIINGNSLANQEIQFENFLINNIRFADGSRYGQNGIPDIWNIIGSSATNPAVRIIINPNGSINMYGSKTSGGPLLPLELFNGAFFNNIIWNSQSNNIVKITQLVQGMTYISGTGGGYKSGFCDLDGDGISNQFDLDSDGDGCFDSIEGDENVTLSQINANGSIAGPVDSQGVPILVNAGGAADIGGDQGQGIGSSQDATINTCSCDPPTITSSSSTICIGQTVTLTSSQATGNTWSTGETTQSIVVTTPGTYTVTHSDSVCTSAPASITIVQGLVPTVQNTGLSVCSDSATATFDLSSAQADISVTPGVSFTYYTNQADAIAGNTNNIANPSAYTSANTTLYVRVASAQGCFNVAELQLNINPNPVPVITASANVICNDNPVTLTSNLPTGNVWSTGETTQTITVSNEGTYTLTNNNGTCISTPASIAILKQIDPNLQIAGNLLFCEGDSTILTATANGTGNTFLWSNGTTGPTNTVTAPGIYSVTLTTALGCQYQQSVTVAMDPIIIVNILPPSQTITCLVTEITLDATASVYQPGATFLWTATAGGNIVSGGNTLNPVVNAGGTYTLTITSATPSGCVKQSSVTVIQNTTPPPVSLTATSLIICKGESTTITAAGAVSYTWNGLPGNANIQTVSPIVTTTYTVTGVGANGCVAQKSITITVVPEIVSSLADIEICKGNKGSLDAGAGPNYTYSWNTGETTQIINPTLEGIYTVIISNGVCAKTFSAKVTYTQVPEILDIVYQDDALTIKVKNLPLKSSRVGLIICVVSPVFHE